MATYYVSTTGSDGAAGTSEGAAWATIDKAMNTVVAGDKVWIKGNGNYNETATIDTTGTVASPIAFEGYSSVTGDNGMATINGQATRANGITNTTSAAASIFYIFKNFRITNHTQVGVLLSSLHFHFKRCKFDTNGTTTSHHGITVKTATFESCDFMDNAGHGLSLTTGPLVCVGCRFYRNGSDGVALGSNDAVFFGCEFFSNNTNGISGGSLSGSLVVVINCTIDGDSQDTVKGISCGTSVESFLVVLNSVIYDCGTGIVADMPGDNKISRNNLVNGNGTAYTNFSTLTGEITSAPAFNSESTNDYRPGTGSPLKNAGYDANTIEGF